MKGNRNRLRKNIWCKFPVIISDLNVIYLVMLSLISNKPSIAMNTYNTMYIIPTAVD